MSGPRRPKKPDAFNGPPMDSIPRRAQTPPGQWQDPAMGGAGPTQEDHARMLRGAFWAGANGDTGALDSFPDTPIGRRQRAEYERGLASRSKKKPGLGFADRS